MGEDETVFGWIWEFNKGRDVLIVFIRYLFAVVGARKAAELGSLVYAARGR